MRLSRVAAIVALSMNIFIAISALCPVVWASNTTCIQGLCAHEQRGADDAASLLQVRQNIEKGSDRGLTGDNLQIDADISSEEEDRAGSGDWNCGEGTKVMRMPSGGNGLTAIKPTSTGARGRSRKRCFYLLACKTNDDPQGKLFLVWTVPTEDDDGSCKTGAEKNHARLETEPEAKDEKKVTVDILDRKGGKSNFEMVFPNPQTRNRFITLEQKARAKMANIHEAGLATARVHSDENQPPDGLSQALRTLVLRNYNVKGGARQAGCQLSDDSPAKLMCSQTYPPDLGGPLADMSTLMADLTDYEFPPDLLAMMNSGVGSYDGLHMSSPQQKADMLQQWIMNPANKEMAAAKFFSQAGSRIFHEVLQRKFGHQQSDLPIWEDVAVMIVLTASYLNKLPPLVLAEAGLVKTGDDYTLYRYAGNDERDVMQAAVGKVYRSEQFVSTTKTHKGWGGKFEWVIKVPANGPLASMTGKDIEGIADKPQEKEVLFPPGALFKVITAEKGAQTATLEAVVEADLPEDAVIVTRETVKDE